MLHLKICKQKSGFQVEKILLCLQELPFVWCHVAKSMETLAVYRISDDFQIISGAARRFANCMLL